MAYLLWLVVFSPFILIAPLYLLSPSGRTDATQVEADPTKNEANKAEKSQTLTSHAAEIEAEYKKCKARAEKYGTGIACNALVIGCWIERWIDDPVALFTYYIVAVTGILAIYTFGLWSAGEQNARRQLRAYVGIVKGDITWTAGKGLIAYVGIRNTGSTPAHDVRVSISSKLLDAAPSEKEISAAGAREHSWVMVPHSNWAIRERVDGLYHFPNIKEMSAEGRRAWVWGTIDYKDSFKEKCHVFFIYSSGDRIEKTVDGVTFQYCWELNPDTRYHAEYGESTRT